jgi:hypothetical protein
MNMSEQIDIIAEPTIGTVSRNWASVDAFTNESPKRHTSNPVMPVKVANAVSRRKNGDDCRWAFKT